MIGAGRRRRVSCLVVARVESVSNEVEEAPDEAAWAGEVAKGRKTSPLLVTCGARLLLESGGELRAIAAHRSTRKRRSTSQGLRQSVDATGKYESSAAHTAAAQLLPTLKNLRLGCEKDGAAGERFTQRLTRCQVAGSMPRHRSSVKRTGLLSQGLARPAIMVRNHLSTRKQ